MVLTQSVTNVQAVAGFAAPSALSRRPSRRPFTAVASCDKKTVARAAPSVQQLLTAGAASALLLVCSQALQDPVFPVDQSPIRLARARTALCTCRRNLHLPMSTS